MNARELRERADRLQAERVPFVHARVVLAERPTSAKPGDEAIVLADGTIEGFVGGQCALATLRAQGLAVLDRRESTLLRIAPTPEPDQPGRIVVHNPCQSGGTLEIFMEPVLPAPLVRILGTTPIGIALARVGGSLGYDMESWDSSCCGGAPDLATTDAVVVASHGNGEEAVLEAAVRAGVPYIGLVASRKRGNAVLAALDLTDEEKAGIRTPAGMDIGARTAEEVALSILAEIIAQRTAEPRAMTSTPIDTAVDPVCHMDVAMIPTSLHADIDGQTWWFCCQGCLDRFTADPVAFAKA
ncbi:MAG: XdhC family protein [Candidatus Nanopelagicales bacterium]